jgi:hypothetical protein
VTSTPADTTQPAGAAAAPAGNPPLPASANEAQAQRTHEGAIVTLPGAATRAAAIFLRNMTAWIVVDGAPTVDAVHLKTALGEFPASVDVSSGSGVTVLRIGLKQPEQIAARADGSNLTVILAPHATESVTAIAFLRDDTASQKTCSVDTDAGRHPCRAAHRSRGRRFASCRPGGAGPRDD